MVEMKAVHLAAQKVVLRAAAKAEQRADPWAVVMVVCWVGHSVAQKAAKMVEQMVAHSAGN